MNVPLARLYHFLENVSDEDMLIYRFSPDGSKKCQDLKPLYPYKELLSWTQQMTRPIVIFHDQEPLNFDFYTVDELWNYYQQQNNDFLRCQSSSFQSLIKSMHLRSCVGMTLNCYDKVLLCHSEQQSEQVSRYEKNGYIGVYWWSHAMIARDWFRYAEVDPALIPRFDCIKKDFLIYNRAWTGTREYRLFFAEQLKINDLIKHCKTSFSAQDADHHYRDHNFKNPQFQINTVDLEDHFQSNVTTPCYSADYQSVDYQQTAIEVVLETLYDDSRWHLTEKSLRPIACGRPFMLLATPGSLKYLKNYGFETFGDYIDESYDNIIDPQQRLQAVIKEMQRISQLSNDSKYQLWENLYRIADKNKKLFFSKDWANGIVEEYRQNLIQALTQLTNHRTGYYWKKYTSAIQNDSILTEYTKSLSQDVLTQIKQLNQQLNINQ